jgi:prepilin-type N-terminal cleavage/methylation domain-containing protein
MNTLQRMRRDDSGFTLVEVLTVSAIIGILSSIAIPVLHSQTSKAQGATAASDLRNTATAMESYFSDHGDYGSASDVVGENLSPELSKGTTIVIVQHSGTAYCLAGLRNAAMPSTYSNLQATALRWYDSAAGGLQPVGTTGCPTTTAVASDWPTDTFSR